MKSGNQGAARAKRHGFSPAMRITRERDFQRAFRGGSRARASHLLVVAVESESPHTRLGLSVGRRIWPRAVNRNRLKGVLREAFRLEYEALPQGLDLVLVPAEPRTSPSLDTARRELVYLAHKAARRLAEKRAKASASPDR